MRRTMQKGRTWTRMGRRSSRHAPALSTWGPTRGPCCPYLLTPTRGPLQFGGDSSARAATASLACAMGNEFMREHLRYMQSKGNPGKGVQGTFYTNKRAGGRFGTPKSKK